MNKDLVTVIYYTSNKEKESFEQKIINDLKAKAGDLPIISVSQKPIDLGTNICIGDVGANDMNLYNQVLTGCEAATTPFVLMAEADCLYPPEYFQFVPPRLDLGYRYNNLYIAFLWKEGFHTKTVSQCGQMIGREYYIGLLKKALAAERVKEILPSWDTFRSENPIINVKTGNGLRKVTWTEKHIPPKDEIPYWGTFKDIKEKYL